MKPIEKLSPQDSVPQTELETLMGKTKDSGAPRKTTSPNRSIMENRPARLLLGFFAATFGILLLVDGILKGEPGFSVLAILLLLGAAVCFVWSVRKMPMSKNVGLAASLLLAIFAVLSGITTFLIKPPGYLAFFYFCALLGLLLAVHFFITAYFPRGRLAKLINNPINSVGAAIFFCFSFK
ncbi:MAG: hypothetical protein FWF41_08490 [Betaproteobacteria bacterium]|nr:hypothetical protein [Betaproteobacteria bacterium]